MLSRDSLNQVYVCVELPHFRSSQTLFDRSSTQANGCNDAGAAWEAIRIDNWFVHILATAMDLDLLICIMTPDPMCQRISLRLSLPL